MAEDAIDKALAGGRLHAAGPCRTKELPLMGAQGYSPALFTDVAQHYRVPHRPGAIDTRVARYLAGELQPPASSGKLSSPLSLLWLVQESSKGRREQLLCFAAGRRQGNLKHTWLMCVLCTHRRGNLF